MIYIVIKLLVDTPVVATKHSGILFMWILTGVTIATLIFVFPFYIAQANLLLLIQNHDIHINLQTVPN